MPLTSEIALILVLIVTVISFFIGLLVGKASPGWIIAGIAIATFMIVVRVVLLKNPQIEYGLFHGDWYAHARPWWGYPPAMFITGAAITLVDRFSVRVLAKAAAAVVFYVSARAVFAAIAMDHTPLMDNFPDPQSGLIRQKTLYSCGPASAAVLLKFEGIHTSEGEMATLCMTNAASATDEFNVRRGLRHKLKGTGKEVVLETTDFETLRRDRKAPMMAVIRFQHLLDHWVVIKSISENGEFEVLDPNGTHTSYSAANFKKIWKNTVLYIR